MTEARREYMREYRRRNKDKIRTYNLANAEKQRAYQIQYRLENADYFKKYFKDHYRENRSKKLAQTKNYKTLHVDYYKDYMKQYFLDHREEFLIRGKAWGKANPEYKKAQLANRRACLQGEISRGDIRAIHIKQKGHCYWCNERYKRGKYHVDHVWPIARGGLNTRANIVIACRTCNLKKGSKSPAEFAGRLF